MHIDFTQEIVCEKDPYKGEAYCIECFGPKTTEFLYFYNSYGPFCCKRCFADYLNVDYDILPNVKKVGVVR